MFLFIILVVISMLFFISTGSLIHLILPILLHTKLSKKHYIIYLLVHSVILFVNPYLFGLFFADLVLLYLYNTSIEKGTLNRDFIYFLYIITGIKLYFSFLVTSLQLIKYKVYLQSIYMPKSFVPSNAFKMLSLLSENTKAINLYIIAHQMQNIVYLMTISLNPLIIHGIEFMNRLLYLDKSLLLSSHELENKSLYVIILICALCIISLNYFYINVYFLFFSIFILFFALSPFYHVGLFCIYNILIHNDIIILRLLFVIISLISINTTVPGNIFVFLFYSIIGLIDYAKSNRQKIL